MVIGASLSEPNTSVTALRMCVCNDHLPILNQHIQTLHEDWLLAWEWEWRATARLQRWHERLGLGATTTEVECVRSTRGNLLAGVEVCAMSMTATWQSMQDASQNTQWQSLLQVRAMYERQAINCLCQYTAEIHTLVHGVCSLAYACVATVAPLANSSFVVNYTWANIRIFLDQLLTQAHPRMMQHLSSH